MRGGQHNPADARQREQRSNAENRAQRRVGF